MSGRRSITADRARITELGDDTTIDDRGAVRSVQTALVSMRADDMPPLWTPPSLERLARSYWAYLSRISLGLLRVEYAAGEPRIVFVRRPLVLLRFRMPEYDTGDDRGTVRWRIRDGVLVARRDEGHLEIRVHRQPADRPDWERALLTVEVQNFYPAVAHWATRPVYLHTQSRLHVLITHGFLRSLARHELEAAGHGAAP